MKTLKTLITLSLLSIINLNSQTEIDNYNQVIPKTQKNITIAEYIKMYNAIKSIP